MTLTVDGLAWQQQDSAVAACATVGVWTMLQSSAFTDRIALPTTAAITEAAHRTASLGERVYPTGGLLNHHMLEAIKEHGLSPILLRGDANDKYGPLFSVARFSSTCAGLIRSGYPVLLIGDREEAGHVVCAVGFRPLAPGPLPAGEYKEEDALKHLYIHDDALGPNVRFRVGEGTSGEALLTPDAPPQRVPGRPVESPIAEIETFIVREIAVAVAPELRVSPDAAHKNGLRIAKDLSEALASEGSLPGLNVSLRFVRVSDYLDQVLASSVRGGAPLKRARLALVEKVRPMSLHVTVARISAGGNAMMDVLYDTSDARSGLGPVAHVVFDIGTARLLRKATWLPKYGTRVRAY
jgi:hypothetical protein